MPKPGHSIDRGFKSLANFDTITQTTTAVTTEHPMLIRGWADDHPMLIIMTLSTLATGDFYLSQHMPVRSLEDNNKVNYECVHMFIGRTAKKKLRLNKRGKTGYPRIHKYF